MQARTKPVLYSSPQLLLKEVAHKGEERRGRGGIFGFEMEHDVSKAFFIFIIVPLIPFDSFLEFLSLFVHYHLILHFVSFFH